MPCDMLSGADPVEKSVRVSADLPWLQFPEKRYENDLFHARQQRVFIHWRWITGIALFSARSRWSMYRDE